MFGYGTFAQVTFAQAPEEAAGAGDITGILAATEGADAAAVNGLAPSRGALSATEGADVAAVAGSARSAGTLAGVEGADTAALTGAAFSRGTLSATEGADTAAINATARSAGTLAGVEGADAATINAIALVTGTLAAVEGADVALVLGSVEESEQPVDPGAGGWIVPHNFSRKRWRALRDAIRETEEKALELTRKKDRLKVLQAARVAQELVDAAERHAEQIENAEVQRISRSISEALEDALSARKSVEIIESANHAIALARAAKAALDEMDDDEEEAILLLLGL